MSYFRTDDEAMFLAVSGDAMQWSEVAGNPILRSQIGGRKLRDPHLYRDENRLFHLLATDDWQGCNLVHATSRDLLSWSDCELIPVMRSVGGARNVWAPECFYDREAKLHRIIWSSTVTPRDDVPSDHRIWGCTTCDFREYSPPEVFFDPGHNVIDACVAWHDGTYWMAYKDERGENAFGTDFKAIRIARSDCATGPFETVTDFITPPLTEGPALFRCGDGWMMLYDHFWEHRFGAARSADGVNWENVSAQMRFPDGARHASVIEVEDELGAALLHSQL